MNWQFVDDVSRHEKPGEKAIGPVFKISPIIKDTTCDMCWNGTSRMDNYEKLCWIGEKVNLAISMWTLASGMGKMWDKVKASDKISWDRMWDWSGTKKQWKNIKAQTCIE